MARQLPSNFTTKPMNWFPSPEPPKGLQWNGANWVKPGKGGKGRKNPKPSRRKTGMGAGRSGGRQSLYGAAKISSQQFQKKLMESKEGYPGEYQGIMEAFNELPKKTQKFLLDNDVTMEIDFNLGKNVDGVYLPDLKKILLGPPTRYGLSSWEKDPEQRANAASSIRHEVGHAVDMVLGEKLRGQPGFESKLAKGTNEPFLEKKNWGKSAISLTSKEYHRALVQDMREIRKTSEGRAFLRREELGKTQNSYYTTPTPVSAGAVNGNWDGVQRNQRSEMFAQTHAVMTSKNPSPTEKEWLARFHRTAKVMNDILKDHL